VQAAGRPEARAVQVEWHPQWRLPLRVMERGRTTDFRYDDAGRLLNRTVIDSTGGALAWTGAAGGARQWTWRYDAQGLPSSHTDPMGRTWTFSHDAWGQLASATDPLGQLTGYSHDVAGRLLAVRAPGGLETRYRYSPRGWLTHMDRGGQVTTIAYTPTGRIASVLAPSGLQHFFAYDAADRLVSIRDERGATRGFELDAAGRPVREWVRDAQGQVLRNRAMRYDERGLLAEQADATGGRVQFTHDANGRLSGQADALGAWTYFELDPLGRTRAMGWPDRSQARLVWELDFLAGVTDPRGVATRYERNAFGELLSETSPDSGNKRYGRNLGGELTSQQDARGQAAQIERDALGRAVRIVHTDGQEVRMAYDAAGALASLEDGSGGTQWQRDMLGRVTLRTQRVDDHPDHPRRQTVTYTLGEGD
jgi:YD repeat-containing protein